MFDLAVPDDGEAREAIDAFGAETAHQITVMADNMGYGERFIPRLIDVLMQVNGVKK